MLDTVLRQAVSHQRGVIMTTVQITLPDQLAQDAQRAGLLSQSSMEKLLREKLQAQRRDEFFAASERMAQVTEPAAMSPEEVADILSRRKFEKKIEASLLTVDQLADRYAELAQVVRPTAIPRIAPDPDDDVVIRTALAAKVDLLVTGDQALRSVGEYQGVRIVGVAEALQGLAAKK